MRDQSGGVLFCPPIERRNFSVKRNGMEEGSELARRRPVHGLEISYGNGGAKATASMAQRLKGGSLKASSSNEVRSEEEEERSSPASRGGEEGLLPQWGRGKRSRGSRADKHTTSCSPARESSAPPPIKNHLLNGISSSTLRSQVSSKAPFCKFSTVCRNDLTGKPSNGSDQVMRFNSARKFSNGKERAASLQKGSLNYSGGRQQQRRDRSDLAKTKAMTNSAINFGEKFVCATNGTSILSDVNGLECNRPKVEWPRIALTLSRREKEEDFLIFKGSKLPQRPRKRLKVVEKALLFCSPGNWLDDISCGRYDVTEKKDVKKKPRGLKVMDIADSDSE